EMEGKAWRAKGVHPGTHTESGIQCHPKSRILNQQIGGSRSDTQTHHTTAHPTFSTVILFRSSCNTGTDADIF
ncbi:hypothetical protein JV213_05590, partial [Plesiomonas shigelloides]|uniref:hypothetical protein n=1 Tax=Plesiomonas shigelloides TaxID=703 RepID=UPI001C05BC36